MSYFYKLRDFLRDKNEEKVVLEFSDIEKILDRKLCESMHKYSAQWCKSSRIAKEIATCGYCLSCNLYKEEVTFYKSNIVLPEQVKGKSSYEPNYDNSFNIDEAIRDIQDYNAPIENKTYARYKSWVYCYKAFKNRSVKSERDIDYLALQLGFYLSSWGMLRNSFLMDNDYKIHIPIVEIILEKQYDCLSGTIAENLIEDKNLKLLIELSDRIIHKYEELTPICASSKNSVTDTLVTKILLGTLGCTPAYDRYYKIGIKKYNITNQTFSAKSIAAVAKIYLENKEAFENERKRISKICKVEYPPMKLIDMCMWQKGIK